MFQNYFFPFISEVKVYPIGSKGVNYSVCCYIFHSFNLLLFSKCTRKTVLVIVKFIYVEETHLMKSTINSLTSLHSQNKTSIVSGFSMQNEHN